MDTLDRITVASPCEAEWDAMVGDDRVRECERCHKHVFALAGLSREEALDLVARTQGGERVCVRFFRRADGTVLTEDCPVGLAARLKRRVLTGLAALAAAAALLATLVGWRYAREPEPVMGLMVCPPPPTAPPAIQAGGRRLPSAQ